MNPLGAVAGQLAAQGVNYAPEIARAAATHGLDPTLLAAVAAQETGGPGANGGHNVVGDGGHGRGLFQIDDRWHDFATSGAAMDPAANADYAAGMLSGLLRRYGGNVRAALSAYNSGSPDGAGTETTWGDGHTLDYADSVLRHYQQLDPHQGRPQRMSINLIGALTGGVEGLVSGLFGGGMSAASTSSGIDPTSLESALSQQSSAFTNINTLSSLAQSQPQSDNLMSSLIDGDDGSN